MTESRDSTYRRIVEVLKDLRVIFWAIALILFILGGVFWLPFSLITFLAGILVTLGFLGTVVYLTLTNERPTESLGEQMKLAHLETSLAQVSQLPRAIDTTLA